MTIKSSVEIDDLLNLTVQDLTHNSTAFRGLYSLSDSNISSNISHANLSRSSNALQQSQQSTFVSLIQNLQQNSLDHAPTLKINHTGGADYLENEVYLRQGKENNKLQSHSFMDFGSTEKAQIYPSNPLENQVAPILSQGQQILNISEDVHTKSRQLNHFKEPLKQQQDEMEQINCQGTNQNYLKQPSWSVQSIPKLQVAISQNGLGDALINASVPEQEKNSFFNIEYNRYQQVEDSYGKGEMGLQGPSGRRGYSYKPQDVIVQNSTFFNQDNVQLESPLAQPSNQTNIYNQQQIHYISQRPHLQTPCLLQEQQQDTQFKADLIPLSANQKNGPASLTKSLSHMSLKKTDFFKTLQNQDQQQGGDKIYNTIQDQQIYINDDLKNKSHYIFSQYDKDTTEPILNDSNNQFPRINLQIENETKQQEIKNRYNNCSSKDLGEQETDDSFQNQDLKNFHQESQIMDINDLDDEYYSYESKSGDFQDMDVDQSNHIQEPNIKPQPEQQSQQCQQSYQIKQKQRQQQQQQQLQEQQLLQQKQLQLQNLQQQQTQVHEHHIHQQDQLQEQKHNMLQHQQLFKAKLQQNQHYSNGSISTSDSLHNSIEVALNFKIDDFSESVNIDLDTTPSKQKQKVVDKVVGHSSDLQNGRTNPKTILGIGIVQPQGKMAQIGIQNEINIQLKDQKNDEIKHQMPEMEPLIDSNNSLHKLLDFQADNKQISLDQNHQYNYKNQEINTTPNSMQYVNYPNLQRAQQTQHSLETIYEQDTTWNSNKQALSPIQSQDDPYVFGLKFMDPYASVKVQLPLQFLQQSLQVQQEKIASHLSDPKEIVVIQQEILQKLNKMMINQQNEMQEIFGFFQLESEVHKYVTSHVVQKYNDLKLKHNELQKQVQQN